MFRQQIRAAREEGFTLIELLIVIVVLGILAGIVVFGVAQFRDDAEVSACKADVKIVSVAVDAFMAKSPTSAVPALADLTAAGSAYLKAPPAASSGIAIDAAGLVTGTC